MHRSGSAAIRILLIILGINFLLDWYVLSGLKSLKTGRRWPLVKWGYLIISLGVTVLFVAGVPSYRSARGMTPYHEWMLSLFVVFFITKVFFVVVLSLGDIGRLFYGIGRRLFGTGAGAGSLIPGRRRFISDAAVLFAAIPFTGFLYAMLKGKYDYRVHRQTVYFDDLPEAFDGFTITQLSDIHSGSFDNTTAVQRGIDLAKEQKSDLFVFTGDLVNNAAWEIEPYIAHFGSLKAPYGQFSVLGNHDYGDYIEWASPEEKAANLEKLKAHHAALGYRLLLDEHVLLEKNGQKIALVGVQNWGKGFIQIGDLDKALEGVDKDAFKICLSHDPTHWEEKIRYHDTTIHLTLAGHTHGAQFGVETDKLRWSPVAYRYLDWAGLANEKNRFLYVNRGFGFLAFSGRLGIWPEITVITLKKTV
ncbi:metallophosphoesterase [Flavitalea sp. BT771]|uniref:metallophosphoesterase n=1 Tax=Flavitalea sp. BT771 TaxID=3063329 RepID=UPI0026E2045C|nr:metallophosphoesterase [Flavitalea sp. BT771]MDO6430790.1 metallophosphoesterase [Flavitalea sp. BT771]MDV6219070.1 metallophosphoesterase [Flavitalea sp. BT771]